VVFAPRLDAENDEAADQGGPSHRTDSVGKLLHPRLFQSHPSYPRNEKGGDKFGQVIARRGFLPTHQQSGQLGPKNRQQRERSPNLNKNGEPFWARPHPAVSNQQMARGRNRNEFSEALNQAGNERRKPAGHEKMTVNVAEGGRKLSAETVFPSSHEFCHNF